MSHKDFTFDIYRENFNSMFGKESSNEIRLIKTSQLFHVRTENEYYFLKGKRTYLSAKGAIYLRV